MNQLLKPLMCLMRLQDTNKPRMDQFMYHVYKTNENMEEHTPNIKNTYILPPEGHQVPNLTKDDEFEQDILAPSEEYDYHSSDEESCGVYSDTESEFDDDDVVHNTQDHVIDPRSNCGRVLKIWSHFWLNFINNSTITTYCIPPLKFLYEHVIRNVE